MNKSEHTPIAIKRYAAGKVYAFADVPAGLEAVVQDTLARAVKMEVILDQRAFIEGLVARGMDEHDICDVLATVTTLNESWLQEVFPS